jgi:Zn-dependent protease with chaperone function
MTNRRFRAYNWFAALLLTALFLLTVGAATAQQGSAATQPQASSQPAITHYSLPPDKLAKAEALYHINVAMFLAGSFYGFAILILFLRFWVGPRFRKIAERATRFRFLQAYIYVPLLLFALAVLNLPFDLYSHHVSRAYGISVQGWGSWFWDWTKGQLVSYAILSLVVWLLYLIIRKSPRRWWFYFWLISLPIMVFVLFISPIVLDPIFNKFEPLAPKNPALAAALHRVTEKAGVNIPESRMFEMKASDKVTVYNAYVTGIGATKRIVVWDTTEHDMTIPEIMFVFGHELGHYVLNHIWKGLAFAAVLSFVGLLIGFWMVNGSLERWGDRCGIRALGDWASLPLLLLILSVISFVGAPIGSAFSRHIEHQADVFGLEVTHGLVAHSSENAAITFQKLGEKSYDYPYPNPVYVFWTYSHPPIADRLEFALHYRPWDEGKPNQFVK